MNGQPGNGMIKEKEQDNDTGSRNNAGDNSFFGKAQASHFKDAKALSGGVYFSIPEDARTLERIAKIKEGLYVPERLPQSMVREGQKGALGAAADVSRAVHTAVQRGRITGGSLFERHQRYKELAEKYIKPQEEAALRGWAQDNKRTCARFNGRGNFLKLRKSPQSISPRARGRKPSPIGGWEITPDQPTRTREKREWFKVHKL